MWFYARRKGMNNLVTIIGILVSVFVVAGVQAQQETEHYPEQNFLQLAQVDDASDEAAKRRAKKKKAANKRVCRSMRETGSRIKQRVCRKQKDWDRSERVAQENVERSYQGGRRDTSGGDN